ncbi:hypothetical protein [Pseudomonas sp. 24 E 1]|nr:hypothetical protein [Pseudomonas sp. 24 E 1]CRM59430.1 hypothetical protein [Pseudomonas sp. 35 E 8]CRM63521.1 hypothetical protein [Pseudomonas sp. 24 R 17]CRM68658.1 hypothetical protein [Pseudomonas sp. 58 R 12]
MDIQYKTAKVYGLRASRYDTKGNTLTESNFRKTTNLFDARNLC